MATKKAKKGAAKAKAKAARATRPARTEPVKPTLSGDAARLLDDLDKAVPGGGLFFFECEGDTVVGELLACDEEKGRWGPQSKYTYREAGTDATRAFYGSTVLDREMEAVKVGDTFGVQYKGTVPSGKGRPAKLFVVKKLESKRRAK